MFFCHLIFGSVVCSGELFTLMDAALVHSFGRLKRVLNTKTSFTSPCGPDGWFLKLRALGPTPPVSFWVDLREDFLWGHRQSHAWAQRRHPQPGRTDRRARYYPHSMRMGDAHRGACPKTKNQKHKCLRDQGTELRQEDGQGGLRMLCIRYGNARTQNPGSQIWPWLSGPSRERNPTREKTPFLKEGGTCSGLGCQRASRGAHTRDPGLHGLCPPVIPSYTHLKGGIQDPSGTALARGIWAPCAPRTQVSPPTTQVPSVLHEVSVCLSVLGSAPSEGRNWALQCAGRSERQSTCPAEPRFTRSVELGFFFEGRRARRGATANTSGCSSLSVHVGMMGSSSSVRRLITASLQLPAPG